jgi:hypothetical protein
VEENKSFFEGRKFYFIGERGNCHVLVEEGVGLCCKG